MGIVAAMTFSSVSEGLSNKFLNSEAFESASIKDSLSLDARL